MAKIFYNGNRIIVDGHAETAEECRAITAMCDNMANDENFKTIVYESGHAVFERVSGGESLKFSDLEAQIQNLQLQIAAFSQAAGDQITQNTAAIQTLQNKLDLLQSELDTINAELDELKDKPSRTLPYTADELIAKLESI